MLSVVLKFIRPTVIKTRNTQMYFLFKNNNNNVLYFLKKKKVRSITETKNVSEQYC